MSFEAFDLHPSIASRVKALGYTNPTPIQEKAIPCALEGRDVMGLAQTGTGKTAAFVLPILERLLSRPKGITRALVIAPTRELTEQIGEAFRSLASRTGLRCVSIYGGVSQRPQVEQLRQGSEVVVACPGRLLDLINQGQVDLSRVEVLVLDEADRMFDMGFLPDIRKIVSQVPKGRQVMLFSATMPKAIRNLARNFMQDPVNIQIGRSAPVETVSHALYPVGQHLKTALLMELLRHTDTESVLIFTRTKHRAKRLDRQLKKAGYNTASLQGNLSQNKRQAAMDGFKNGIFRILVATDIAARGIDVNHISHVINFDIPDTADAYTHRIGRTGRAAKNGNAFTLVTPQDESSVSTIEKLMGTRIERRTLSGFDYHPAPKPGGAGRPADHHTGSQGARTGNGRKVDDKRGYRTSPRSGPRRGRSRRTNGGRAGRNTAPRSGPSRSNHRGPSKNRYGRPPGNQH